MGELVRERGILATLLCISGTWAYWRLFNTGFVLFLEELDSCAGKRTICAFCQMLAQ